MIHLAVFMLQHTAMATMINGTVPCETSLDCSLNGVCTAGICSCDSPWTGPRCGILRFASPSPAAGRDLWPVNDTAHNTWNGPMIGPEDDGLYHMYLPVYAHPSTTPLYNPTDMFHGTASHRLGPWTWRNLTGVDVNFNPGALVYGKGTHKRYTIWVSGHPGKIYHSQSPDGPFTEIPGSNATVACSINPSPLFVNGTFYCTGQKGGTIMTAPHLGGPWKEYATIDGVRGEDPFLYVDKRGNWHALYHSANGSQVNADVFSLTCRCMHFCLKSVFYSRVLSVITTSGLTVYVRI